MTLLRRWNHRTCLSDGTLRSALDNGVERMPEVTLHLDECATCRQRMAAISHTAVYASGRLALLANDEVSVDVAGARQSMRIRISESAAQDQTVQGESFVSTMWRYRAARGAVAMLALMLLTTAFVATPMRSLADDIFNRFRVEKFEAVTIQPEQFEDFQTDMLLRALTSDHQRVLNAVEGMLEIESTFDHDNPENEFLTFDSADAARAAYGEFTLPGDLPDGFSNDPQFMMSSAGSVTATVDTASVHVIIEELRLPVTSIPSASDMPQMVFNMDIPAALVTYYNAGLDGHLAVVQMESPTLVTPEGLDMEALREDVLSFPGLPEEFVSQLRAIDDWQQTLVIPVPEGARTSDVSINGEGGLLIEAGEFDGGDWGIEFQLDGDVSIVMWHDDGVLYIVAGTVGGQDVLNVAGSLR